MSDPATGDLSSRQDDRSIKTIAEPVIGRVLTDVRGAMTATGLSIPEYCNNQSQFLYDVAKPLRQITALGRGPDVNLQATISGDGKRVALPPDGEFTTQAMEGGTLPLHLPANEITQVTNAP